jgi:hypothetical protein
LIFLRKLIGVLWQFCFCDRLRVIRSIKAGDWSTICLPFAMSEAQCQAAFGDDVELANFSSWSSEEDDDGNIISLAMSIST